MHPSVPFSQKSLIGLGIVTVVLGLHVLPSHAGNTTCASSQLDWYTSVVGESPCELYSLAFMCGSTEPGHQA